MDNKVYAPADWGKLKSNTHYAEIDGKVIPIRPTKDFILYKGRWRPIGTDGYATWVEYPGATVCFEIKQFDKQQ